MKIIRVSNPDVTSVTTTLSSAVCSNNSEIEVTDASSLSANDIILIEDVGFEKCEIAIIDSIIDNTLTLTTELTMSHSNSTTITKINYNQYTIKKATVVSSTKTTVVTNTIDYANPINCIEYIDQDYEASDELFYFVYYYNSVTETEYLAETLHQDLNYGYMDVENFRAETAFTESEVSDAEVQKAIYNALEWIQDNAYVTHEFSCANEEYMIIDDALEFADYNGDNVIDYKDFIIYEYDSNSFRRYLSSKIAKIIPESKKILFTESLPINSQNTLVIKVPLTFKKLGEILYSLKTVTKLIATNWILENVDTSKIKSGITSWTAGGTSVNRDLNNLRESIKQNLFNANRVLTQIAKIYIKPTKLRTRHSSLNYGVKNNAGLAYQFSSRFR